MLKIWIFIFLLGIPFLNNQAQIQNITIGISSSVSYTTPNHLPFWLRSCQFGSVPLDNTSLNLTSSISREFDRSKRQIFDWGASIEGRTDIGKSMSVGTLNEGYLKLRISIFEIRAGRSKEITGLCDTSLSSGSFAVSGNALGIPKIEIKIPEFFSLPAFHKIIAFKGNYAHGVLGKVPFNNLQNVRLNLGTYVHQVSFYGRLGKPEWRFKLYGGFNHNVLWGNEKIVYGDLTPLKSYLAVITGKPYDSHIRIGDHLGSIDLGLEYQFENLRLFIYRQNFYEAGALYYLANIRDGLNGISLTNKIAKNNRFRWKKILFEVLYTKSQGGESWSVERPSGAEDYYNNWQYLYGWSYKGNGIGNPFLSSSLYTRKELGSDPLAYFINNRVAAFHFGYEGIVNNWTFILKTSYSLNYGTYRTVNTFGEKNQFSAFMETTREFKKGLNIGFSGAFDMGELYYNSVGAMVKVGKRFEW